MVVRVLIFLMTILSRKMTFWGLFYLQVFSFVAQLTKKVTKCPRLYVNNWIRCECCDDRTLFFHVLVCFQEYRNRAMHSVQMDTDIHIFCSADVMCVGSRVPTLSRSRGKHWAEFAKFFASSIRCMISRRMYLFPECVLVIIIPGCVIVNFSSNNLKLLKY